MPDGRPLTAVVSPAHLRLLRWLAQCSVVHYVPEAVQADLLVPPVTAAQTIVLRSNVRLGAEELDRMPELRLVVRAGSGTDNIDVAGLAGRGIELVVVGGQPSAPAVAELAVQAAIALLRQVPAAAAALAAGRWDKNRSVGRELAASTAAVWGAGPVGRAVGHLLDRIGSEVAFLEHPGVSGRTAPLTDLCERADVHFLALPLRPTTRHIVDAATLGLMAPRRPVLVNVARWDLVDMSAALAALDRGDLSGLAVDPVERAQLAFLACRLSDGRARNVQLTPHLGAMTNATQDRVAGAIIAAMQSRWTGPVGCAQHREGP